jgi:aminomethyltransferase
VSRLGKIEINGAGALEYLDAVLTNDFFKIENGSAQYNLICNDQGGVIDDLIVYRRNEEDLYLNAANCAEVVRTLQDMLPVASRSQISIKALGSALQGPLSQHVTRALGIIF